MMNTCHRHLILSLSVFLLATAGCASSKLPQPTSELAVARQAIEQAEQVGAEEYAPLEIRNARQKLEEAQASIEEGENGKAKMLIARAMADAELAEGMSLSSKAEKAVNELQATIQALREEIERNQNN